MHRQSQLNLRLLYVTTARLYHLSASKVLRYKNNSACKRQLQLVLLSRALPSKKPIFSLLTCLFLLLLSESFVLDGLRKSKVSNLSSKLLLLNVPYTLQKNIRYSL